MTGAIPAELLEAIDRLGFAPWTGLAYRHTAPRRNGLSGAGARIYGGRWNPPNLVSTLYLAQPRTACIAEFVRMAEGQGQGTPSFLPRTIHHIQVTELMVLDHTGDGLGDVGLDLDDISAPDWAPCQLVGSAAHFLGAAGIVAPSATGLGITIAIFETRVQGELTIVNVDEIDPDGDLPR